MDPTELTLKNIYSIEGRGHFPRPDCIRLPSFNLHGQWIMAFDKQNRGIRLQWYNKENAGKIISGHYILKGFESYPVEVPFPLEADVNSAIHVKSHMAPDEIIKQKRFWYFCSFGVDAIKSGRLHFGACDYKATVWLNGRCLGFHEGGYTPFSFFVPEFEDINYLVVLVEDSISPSQIRGKQTFLHKPFLVWYTNSSGIWQDVWIEQVASTHITSQTCTRDAAVCFAMSVESQENVRNDITVELKIFASQVFGKRSVLKTPVKVYRDIVVFDVFKKGQVVIEVPLSLFDVWSPSHPAVHPIQVVLKKAGKEIDCIHSYFGRRDVTIQNGRILLNKKNIYQRLLLNQGYYPEGLYRPVDTMQYKSDIEIMKSLGFNGCRIHQKIEDPRFLYWADMVGFLIWEEMPSYYLPLQKNMQRLYAQLQEVMARDCMHPSIITLVLYNESWGLYSMFLSRKVRNSVIELFNTVKSQYPGYLIIDNSGFHHLKSDITDIHHYLRRFEDIEELYKRLVDGVREAPLWTHFFMMILGKENIQTPYLKGYGDTTSPIIISEMGGFGFGIYPSEAKTLEESFQKHCSILSKFPQIQGFCYTQFTDTFQETNGVVTFDRRPKAKLLPIMQKALAKHIFW
ncbi:MAG TPA: glycoside hydrolase family 2 TIM barrel-domain containing protein [Spirochaetota bacterium]|nr:glycoside hydrolase family 2 TIM barrel-domain containing protein [Spirochaetota bacterium]